MFKRFVEKNGLRVVIRPMRDTRATSVFVLVGVGWGKSFFRTYALQRNEKKAKQLSHSL